MVNKSLKLPTTEPLQIGFADLTFGVGRQNFADLFRFGFTGMHCKLVLCNYLCLRTTVVQSEASYVSQKLG